LQQQNFIQQQAALQQQQQQQATFQQKNTQLQPQPQFQTQLQPRNIDIEMTNVNIANPTINFEAGGMGIQNTQPHLAAHHYPGANPYSDGQPFSQPYTNAQGYPGPVQISMGLPVNAPLMNNGINQPLQTQDMWQAQNMGMQQNMRGPRVLPSLENNTYPMNVIPMQGNGQQNMRQNNPKYSYNLVNNGTGY